MVWNQNETKTFKVPARSKFATRKKGENCPEVITKSRSGIKLGWWALCHNYPKVQSCLLLTWKSHLRSLLNQRKLNKINQINKCIREEGHGYQLSLYKYTIFKFIFLFLILYIPLFSLFFFFFSFLFWPEVWYLGVVKCWFSRKKQNYFLQFTKINQQIQSWTSLTFLKKLKCAIYINFVLASILSRLERHIPCM